MWIVTRKVEGKTLTKALPAGEAVERTRQQIAEYRRFRKLTRELVETNVQICDLQLRGPKQEAATKVKKTALGEVLGHDLREEIERLVGGEAAQAMEFEAVETAVRRQTLRFAARVVEQRLNADHSDFSGASRSCSCGRPARYVDRRAKPFQTVLGELRLERAYYYCATCQRGFCPRDQELGMKGTSLSPAVTRMIGTVGALVSFQEGSGLLRELAGVEVGAKQVERTAEALGAEVAEDGRQQVEAWREEPLPSTLYLGLDGTGIPMRREELEGRAGKQADGSAQTREVKVCAIWSAESRDAEGLPRRDEGSVSYSAAIETAASRDTDLQRAEFTQRVEREAQRRGFSQVLRQVVIGDGAPWIWNLAEELFPQALQIVDRFHVKEHLSQVAKAVYGQDEAAHHWAQRRHQELDSGRSRSLTRALARHAPCSPEARNCLQCLERNRQRMRYPEFHAQGLCTSSGVLEAGCKVVVGSRLKRSGMHWTVHGSNAIIALRCYKLSGRFEDFWERRAESVGA
jgi:hypothetical protein